MDTINKILICGGTHGNELSGIYAVSHWLKNDSVIKQHITSAQVNYLLVNEAAIEANVRFIDEDFNRQFAKTTLQKNASSGESLCHEAALAQTLNQRFGPKELPQLDFLIDIHNTTSAMGPTLIVLSQDAFNVGLARHVKSHMPSANILVEEHLPYEQLPYFCTLGRRSVMIEVGAQAQGTLRATVYQQTVEMTQHILSFIEIYNEHGRTQTEMPALSEVEAYKFLKDVSYPLDESGARTAMIHPNLDGNDFNALNKGEPCFIDFDGKDIIWEEDTVYPHFIGEAAYNKLHLAFATAYKTSI
ncbi:aspartoacylase [Glaciecola sp. XM2]|uniref:aspartoacylase n=1 Tax=Glaciecola sp. XM2 TaxID=1914931 RepID=UPI001BDF724B|nr:aspartoacylase [Glaciecola sp. XM2]MBT1450523.1 aspartoacylase [Glaciecola sp. XM2]